MLNISMIKSFQLIIIKLFITVLNILFYFVKVYFTTNLYNIYDIIGNNKY